MNKNKNEDAQIKKKKKRGSRGRSKRFGPKITKVKKGDEGFFETDKLAKRTRFNADEVTALSKIYKALTAHGKMDRLRFRDFIYSTFDITDDLMLDRIYGAFGEDNVIVSESAWIIGLSIMLRGSLEEKGAFCFKVYDITGDASITREEIEHFLRSCLTAAGSQIDDEDLLEALKECSEIALRKLDTDKNGSISADDFIEACTRDPNLLESLGHCLPSESYIKAFLALFADDYEHFDSSLSNPNDQSFEMDFNKFSRGRGGEGTKKQSKNSQQGGSKGAANSTNSSNLLKKSSIATIDSHLTE